MKLENILEQFQFCIGIYKDTEDEILSFNLSPAGKKKEKSIDFTDKNKKVKNISDAVGEDWLEIN